MITVANYISIVVQGKINVNHKVHQKANVVNADDKSAGKSGVSTEKHRKCPGMKQFSIITQMKTLSHVAAPSKLTCL